MRGKGAPLFLSIYYHRITPAYAGKRPQFCGLCGCRWDHPRVCGEKSGSRSDDRVAKGSPPRMRGKVTIVDVRGVFLGITPAYAGKSFRSAILL